MVATWLKKQRDKMKDNRGSAMVLVIIAIAFVGTLIAMLVYMVYFNYMMKYADRAAKSNFYTAETALEVVKAGLEKDISEAMVISYYDVMSNHTSESALNKQAAFEEKFMEYLTVTLLNVDVAHAGDVGAQQAIDVYDPTMLSAYWSDITRIGETGFEGFKIATTPGTEGARMEVAAWDEAGAYGNLASNVGVTNLMNDGPVIVYNGSVIELHNVRVSYTDEKGYVSVIETDIILETPKINFANVLTIPQLESYSLVASGGIYDGYVRDAVSMKPTVGGGPASTVITGNVFGGEDGVFVNGVSAQISFEQKAGDDASRVYTLTADSVNAISGRTATDVNRERPAQYPSVKIDDSYEVWAGDLYADSATLDIAANCFVQDDLTTDGTYPGVYLSGDSYSGYGSATGTAAANSAILINGAHTTLDMYNLKQLELAGHAYVGSIHYNANEEDATLGDYIPDLEEYAEKKAELEKAAAEKGTTLPKDEYEKNEDDVLMGQSIAVKSDQILYMVPTECMGYDGDSQILGKNPMTYDEYVKLTTTYEPQLDINGNIMTDENGIVYSDELRYDVVRLDVVMNKVGGSINSYGANYVPVFRRVSGDILVYYYIAFSSDDKANEFFQDYYREDPEAFERYMDSYVDTYRINPNIVARGSTSLSIAGNMLYKSGNNYIMKEDTLDEELEAFEAIAQNRETNGLYYRNLSKYLMKTTDDLAAGQIMNTVFDNIAVSAAEYDVQVTNGTFMTYKDTDDKVVALVINNKNKGVFDFSSSNSQLTGVNLSDIHLIIVNGDIRVDVVDYDGLIFAGGDIYIGPRNKTIDYDASLVPLAMTAKNSNGSYVFEVIQNGVAYANTLGTTDAELLAAIEQQREADVVRAADLVRFVNWTKE